MVSGSISLVPIYTRTVLTHESPIDAETVCIHKSPVGIENVHVHGSIKARVRIRERSGSLIMQPWML